MTKHVVCSECGKGLIADDYAEPENVVCNHCMPKIVKKARAYGNYMKAVDEGDIVVLNRKEILELLGGEGCEKDLWPLDRSFICKFLEDHSNWRRRP